MKRIHKENAGLSNER